MLFERDDAADVLRYFRGFIADAPREYGAFPAWHFVPLPFVPEDRWRAVPHVVSCWTGDHHDSSLPALPRRRATGSRARRPMPTRPQRRFDALVPRGWNYLKTLTVKIVTDEAIAAHLPYEPRVPAVNTAVHMYPINAACHDVAADATAFSHRDANYAFVIAGMWPDPADNEANIQ